MRFLNEPTQRQKCDAQQHRNNYVLSLHFFQFTSKKSEVKKLKSTCLNSLNSHPLLTKEFALTFWSSKALRSLM